MHTPKSELIDAKSCDREWYNHFKDNCKDREYSAYHGTSRENTKKILKDGFKMATGSLGRGVYFDGQYTPYSVDVNKHTAVRYAKDNDRGSVIATCIPFALVKTSKNFYKQVKLPDAKYEWETEWVTPKWFDKFQELQSQIPESLELYFSWHGHKFDTMDEVRDAWNKEGEKVRKFALDHGIKVYSDQREPSSGQYVVYDPKVLKLLKLRELTSCRTRPKIDAK